MNQSSPALPHLQSHSAPATHPIRRAVALTLGISMLAALSACSGVSNLTKERVAQSDTSVQQAQQTVGNSEHGARELQQARDKLSAAKSALAAGHEQQAERSAAQAHLYAELALVKSQSAHARKGAEEVLAGLEMLRRETERTTPSQR
jgi:hypothetical protein